MLKILVWQKDHCNLILSSVSAYTGSHVIAKREKPRNLDVSHCNLVMHYFALAADTTHHGTIFIPIVHSVFVVAHIEEV